ncbi:hypothetical protein EZ313_11435 [Ramlibacter henchirensis]|uniref:TolA protein n=1 Tax=Ramlibacter henchirensis TaxID=204072 RepID=A0A4Z0C5Y8_9BURK|nr:hypothetical protein [Ramlibacter henchirensis]TFZ07187.1 hypothetical protein EZ313_11435 [Ramlibacter henchirensis]
MAYTGHVEGDGSLRLKGTGLLGVLTAETLRHDAAAGTMYANAHELKAGTPQQLTSATRGFPQAAAALAQIPAPAPVAAASAPSSDADLRAELAAMKAKVDQLSKQLEQAPPPAPARPLSPAKARAKAAEDKRIADAKVREEAQRQAAERRAKAEEEKRQQAEARARAAEAKAAEARRLVEEKRAQQEAARREAEERRAQQEAAKREAEAAKVRAAEEANARAAEEARARAAQAAAAARPPAAPAPNAAPVVALVPGGPVRPGLYSTGTGYDVDVKVVGDALQLRELAYNRESLYRPISPGSRTYGYVNPNTGTHFALTVENETTLIASRFDKSTGQVLPNGTPLKFAGGGRAQPVSGDDFKDLNDVAQKYLRKAQTEPQDAQAWSFCGMAAMARAHGQNDVQVRQAAQALKSISTTQENPCGDAIPNRVWNSVN